MHKNTIFITLCNKLNIFHARLYQLSQFPTSRQSSTIRRSVWNVVNVLTDEPTKYCRDIDRQIQGFQSLEFPPVTKYTIKASIF
jgi:hypothetical protein